MSLTPKEELSQHLETVFKGFVKPGLHICDFATGGGKSYTIGKLVSQYYPNHFDRIVLISVQKKLDDSLNKEIDSFIKKKGSLIKKSDKLVVENNKDVLLKGLRSGAFQKFIQDTGKVINNLNNIGNFRKALTEKQREIADCYKEVNNFISVNEGTSETIEYNEKLLRYEQNLRKATSFFLKDYIKYLKSSNEYKNVTVDILIQKLPSLPYCYPQIDWKRKKVLTMTLHKAMLGIDTIISSRIGLHDFIEPDKKTLIIFDESDQAAGIMRSIIIEQSIMRNGGASANGYENKDDLRFRNGYEGMMEYCELTNQSIDKFSEEYIGQDLKNCLTQCCKLKNQNWAKIWGENLPMFNDILLSQEEMIGQYRRGVFFSGAVRLNISYRGDKTKSYICYKEGKHSLTLVHTENESDLKHQYKLYISLEMFLFKVLQIMKGIKAKFGHLIYDTYEKHLNEYYEELKSLVKNPDKIDRYKDFPTLENEIYTFFSRFGTSVRDYYVNQMTEFLTRRKNLAIKRDGKKIKVPDYSVYSQGVQLFIEGPDPLDRMHRVRMSNRDINTTPESMMVDLVSRPGTSIVFCSATASNQSVISNFDLDYLRHVLGNKMFYIKKEDLKRFDELAERTLPAKHKIEIIPIDKHCLPEKENDIKLPDRYREMFSPEAIEEGLPDRWFHLTFCELNKVCNKKIKDVVFHLERLLQFIEVYHWFHHHQDVRSMIFFQNRSGHTNRIQYQCLSSLIDGSYKHMTPFGKLDIPKDWNNPNICISKDQEEIEQKVLSKLSSDKDAKIMLITAYGSFKAGVNLQYPAPEGLKILSGDNWRTSGDRMKKDWDAAYFQSPTAYLMMNRDNSEWEYEKSLYTAMLNLMMLRERGYLSVAQVGYWLYKALIKDFKFGDKSEGGSGINKDKAAWALTLIEQAVGRLCRTRNKPPTTYILYETQMEPYFSFLNTEKSLTKEFKTLAYYILSKAERNNDISKTETAIRENQSRNIRITLRDVRKKALYYTPSPYEQSTAVLDEDDMDEESEFNTVKRHQNLLQCFKRAILRNPTVADFQKFDIEDRLVSFLPQCYGDYTQDVEDINLPTPSSTRLDIMMKNPVIKSYFEKMGYATEWSNEKLMLHPEILAFDYAGEIGEEAFKALVLHYTDCKEENIRHLENKDYELADFVIVDEEGKYRLAFDVKNLDPTFEHVDKPSDMSTFEKREIKRERLNCEIITVNILRIDQPLFGDMTEIPGIIDTEGKVVPSAISKIQMLISTALKK